ncbi:MAG: Shedu immune nuclease family protein [Bacteroidota bacterium]
MITFKIIENNIIASYTTRGYDIEWLIEKLKNDEYYDFQKTFTFSNKDLVIPMVEKEKELEPNLFSQFDEFGPIDFIFATLQDDYYIVKKGVLTDKFDIYIYKEVNITISLFVVESDISIFKKIENLIEEDVYIGGPNKSSIQEETFLELIKSFPNAYEKKLYADAKITNIIKEFFSTTKDIDKKFQKYLNKKETKKGIDLIKTFKETELIKYETILEKLTRMLFDENNYSERQWQNEILQIILLLYPKYISVFTEVPINADGIKEKYLDFLLVDSNGHIDIIEIKKPFENSIMTKGLYRDNYIPLRELSGTVMQIEKYIYYLNRLSIKGEKILTEKYKENLPDNFKIKITNPSGIVIMGRENKLSSEQKHDFEVVKRKYKNVIDIITYDNILERLKLTISQIKKV